MNKICVASFLEDKEKINFRKGRLCVDSLLYNTTDVHINDINTDILLKPEQEKRNIIRNWIIKCFNECINNIYDMNSKFNKYIIYTLPKFNVIGDYYYIFDDLEYDIDLNSTIVDYAMNYINKLLLQKHFDTLRIGHRKLFISWKYLELNISNKYK